MSVERDLLKALKSFACKLERGEEIEMTRVQRVKTPDGPLHLRKIVRMNETYTRRCIVYPIHIITTHPETEHLVIADVGEHRVVTGNHYDEGVLGVFIPDGAIIPDKLADEMRVLGKLAGKKGNRVKAKEMLGVYSEGLFYGSRFFDVADGQKVYDVGPSWNSDWIEGQDVTEELGISFK
jgi:hypothetical protein